MAIALRRAVWVVGIGLTVLPPSLVSAVTPLPAARHHRYLTYGLFLEEGTSLYLRESGAAWLSVGASLPFLEFTGWTSRPQLVLHGNVTASLRNVRAWDYRVETFDGRFGATMEFELGERWRLLAGVIHASGHVADGTDLPALIPPNLGDDGVVLRLIWDLPSFRVGASLRPWLSTDPGAQSFAADQFLEWFPFSTAEPSGTPYLALGLEEGGPKSVELSAHVQLGVYWGSHRAERHYSTLRVLIGYYEGIDPRLKFARFIGGRRQFWYGGVALNF